ncbi:MAG TPA: DNA mismatch repair endonuclease MutL [Mobilitalea sp.]|nr:DNA mismatch repair endonuclease MutL [Mobilitalea sp.]
MPFIHILDESTINQIAAGEVVERPSAVVKELIENAMDAGATAITAEIKEGGLSFIRITDNGNGIAKEDIPLAFLRHATSKIRSAEDLLSVTSLGFRGEALSSIAAVAQVELITKTPTSLNGFRYIIEGGEEKSMEEIGSPSGTTIIVRNIFYNTPARRKFLKSAITEAGYISDLMERLIISHPEVSFKFIVNNQVKLQSSGNNNSKDILYHIYGRDISKELLTVEHSTDGIKVSGFIGKPIINRGNRNFENYFINGRYIKSNIITKAIEEAYKPFLMQHKYPFTSIYYEIDPAVIDVNVHPQKMEIRLKNSEEIYQLTYQLIRNTLSGKEMIPKVHLTNQQESKQEAEPIPEPFEANRRKQFEDKSKPTFINSSSNISSSNNSYAINPSSNDISRGVLDKSAVSQPEKVTSQNSYSYGKGMNQPYHKVAETNTDYITATKPLIQSGSPLAGAITREIKGAEPVKAGTTGDSATMFQSPVVSQSDHQEYLFRKDDANSTSINKTMKNDITSGLYQEINQVQNKVEINKGEINREEINKEEINKKEINKELGKEINREFSNALTNNINNEWTDEFPANTAENTLKTGITLDSDIQDEHTASSMKASDSKIISSEQITLFSEASASESAPFLSKKAMEEHRIIGQIFSTYWLVEYKKELYIIDQHAAHEKVLFEKIMTSAKLKTYESQQLLPPIVLTLTLKEQEILAKHEEVLNSLGYEFEHFGGNEYSVRAVPADLYSISEKELLLEFIDALAEDVPGAASHSNSILERAASLSCKSAVKANYKLSYEEAAALIKELLTLENPYHCPHGRPVIISMSQYELERKFKRIL